MLSPVTIVGMRFYAGAHDYIHRASKEDVLYQCLYLVPEKDNKYDVNAVMLHNGKIKLGSVESNDAAKLKRLFSEWEAENGGGIPGEDVLVVRCDSMPIDAKTFEFKGSVHVRGMYRVNERLARKFSNKNRKD